MSTIKVDTIATRTGSGNITASNTIAGTSATLSGTLGVTGNTTVGGTLVNTGLITASAGVAIGGTGAANTLDDYEEGSWTPVVADSSSGGNTASGTFVGQYIKVGKFVQIYCSLNDINTSGMTSGNSIHVQGLPFTVSFSDSGNSANLFGIGTVETDRITFENYITTRVNHDFTFIVLRDNDVNSQDSSVKISDVNSSGNSDIYITMNYPSA